MSKAQLSQICSARETRALVPSIAIIFTLFATSAVAFDLWPGGKIANAKARCETDGKYKGGNTVATQGLFEGMPSEQLLFMHAAEIVLGRRFSFVEFERKPIPPSSRVAGKRSEGNIYYNQFHENHSGKDGGEKYVRIFVAPVSDERCAPFKHYVESYPNLLVKQLRWMGLPPSKCLALEKTNELLAQVEHIFVPEKRLEPGETGEWDGWIQYRDKPSGKILGKVWIGGYYSRDRGFTCPNGLEYSKLDALVTPTGNPDLSPVLPVEEVTGTRFPTRQVAFVVSVGAEKPAQAEFWPGSKAKFVYEDWNLPNELFDNGNSFISPLYDKDSHGISLAGFAIYLIRPAVRRVIRVADNGQSFNSCDSFRRLGSLLTVMCERGPESLQNSAAGTKMVWGNWLLTYEDDGTPRDVIRFNFDNSRLSNNKLIKVLNFNFGEADTLEANVHYWRDESGKRQYYQAPVVFRLTNSN